MSKNTEQYYNEFSKWYENQRHRGYHAFLDDMELKIAAPYVRGVEVLEAGCGTGLILKELATLATRAEGVDISEGMLEKARERGLTVHKASVTDLPFKDGSFDTVVSFKVLAHVPDLPKAIEEMARVTRPGGHLVLEFYNKASWRYLVKRLKPAQKVADGTFDTEVHTAYHSWDDILGMLPSNVKAVSREGIRIVTPSYHPFSLPVVGPLTCKLEELASASPLRRFGGFLIGVFKVN
jgi:ubiquinone/menaquinone biosynthesis C-methylase UbiE